MARAKGGDGFLPKVKNEINFLEYSNMEIVSGHCIHSFPVHIHESLCVGFITEGCAELVVNGRKTILTVGDCYIIPPYTPHSLSSVAFKMLGYVVLCYKGIYIRNQLSDAAAKAKAFIEKAVGKFTLGALSKEVHISKYHLDRVFKEQVGITPYQFYIHSKIRKIRQGLHMDSSLSDLVYDLDFTDQSHLCNVFKKHMGISPVQYASCCGKIKAAPV